MEVICCLIVRFLVFYYLKLRCYLVVGWFMRLKRSLDIMQVQVSLSSSLLVNLHRSTGLEVLVIMLNVNGVNQGLHAFIAQISLYGSLDILSCHHCCEFNEHDQRKV